MTASAAFEPGTAMRQAPVYEETLLGSGPDEWMMTPGERVMLHFLLEHRRPATAIEVGTARGGSLGVIAPFAGRVYSFDIDPACSQRLAGRYDNVTYVVGDSAVELPRVLAAVPQDEPVGFILIDGGHSYETVRDDLKSVVPLVPRETLYVLMHDAFLPGVRQAIREADWAGNAHVHSLHLDLVHGTLGETGTLQAGFALATMRPQPREGELRVYDREAMYRVLHAKSRYAMGGRIVRKLKRLVGLGR